MEVGQRSRVETEVRGRKPEEQRETWEENGVIVHILRAVASRQGRESLRHEEYIVDFYLLEARLHPTINDRCELSCVDVRVTTWSGKLETNQMTA